MGGFSLKRLFGTMTLAALGVGLLRISLTGAPATAMAAFILASLAFFSAATNRAGHPWRGAVRGAGVWGLVCLVASIRSPGQVFALEAAVTAVLAGTAIAYRRRRLLLRVLIPLIACGCVSTIVGAVLWPAGTPAEAATWKYLVVSALFGMLLGAPLGMVAMAFIPSRNSSTTPPRRRRPGSSSPQNVASGGRFRPD
jgi:hypothetical protein